MSRTIRHYKPQVPFNVAMKLLVPTETKVKGVTKKVYPEPEDIAQIFFGSFRTFGGTENFSNDVYMIYNTATIDTWYNPEITTDCRVYICETGEIFDVISPPEDINMRHQFMQFKVEKIGGKP